MSRRLQIGVIGSAGKEEYKRGGGSSYTVLKIAREIGSLLAQKDIVLVTGGKGGVMEAAAKGAKEANGLTIGIVKGTQRFVSNKYIDIEVISGMAGEGLDELLLVQMCDALIVLGGGAGTLQELAIAYRNRKPIVVLRNSGGWADKLAGEFLDQRETIKIDVVETLEQAISKVVELAKTQGGRVEVPN
jgi:uncharacterized protein (TIGR00725 family)